MRRVFMKKTILTMLLLVVAMCFMACGSENVIVLRSSGPLTGDYSVYGIATDKGMQLAVEEINQQSLDLVSNKLYEVELLLMVFNIN